MGEPLTGQSPCTSSRSRGAGASRQGPIASQFLGAGSVEGAAELYWKERDQTVRDEESLAFDHPCKEKATELETRVDAILKQLRRDDVANVYARADPRRGHGGQLHPRHEGDHFLSNAALIEETEVFKVLRQMPKGAHLHIHFNACLPPDILLGIAKGMDRMFITSDHALLPDAHGGFESYDRCEIQFSILSREKEDEKPGDIFSPEYLARQTMKFTRFLDEFREQRPGVDPDEWLLSKLVFEEQEAHGLLQTSLGAWEKFNGRTRMMKGLFNYEKAYRRYTAELLRDFVRDGIQYAEIRPNFMSSNQLLSDDGTRTIDNDGIMKIIIEEVTNFKKDPELGASFHGLKIIYCFDLVGEEAKGNPIREFVPQLLEFKMDCQREGVEIPFLFHCGETLDNGTDTDGNLVDALLLGSKRIGHGFALPKHPHLMQQMKEHNVCVELCPISNEILGLTPRVNGHAMYQLLANNVHCSVSSDNGTLFRSSLSHDFYQVMAGKADMGLWGWKQLILWSLEHACLDADERPAIMKMWENRWQEFLQEVDGQWAFDA
ncbi:Adenosine deaminase CECR1 [Escovopsis weberi]|uniref:Adenosine deaminase CECR1 n=1 Tax=Escovopsis weberi TaxID=150374 RepID=A0A0M8N8Y2_ESCWE|nr:Adenosine deaminase CECR1 [Escovopsis weberi]